MDFILLRDRNTSCELLSKSVQICVKNSNGSGSSVEYFEAANSLAPLRSVVVQVNTSAAIYGLAFLRNVIVQLNTREATDGLAFLRSMVV